MSKLVIVESPSKAKTIKKYLGKGYEVVASKGHIRDLPKSKLGIDVDNGFKPQYINMVDKRSVIKELKENAKNSDGVILATDPDREGEAISWHLSTILGLDMEQANRVAFNEITKSGVQKGMSNPRKIDLSLVDAQQARRVLDRLVGYKLSPFLWKKIRSGLSAGRVQSVALKLIVDREKEIEAFVPEEFWTVDAKFIKNRKQFGAKFFGTADGKKVDIKNKSEADKILSDLEDAEYTVSNIKKGVRRRQPSPPFNTSTLQQEAARKLSFTGQKTMSVAQQLYEGVDIPGLGTIGLITYMRTDSLRISDEARKSANDFILSSYGEKYLPEKPRYYKTKSGAQDAHEAIRPTTIDLIPEKVKSSLSSDQFRLYKLIWERFIASLMSNCELNTVSVDITAKDYLFKSSGFSVKFDGFTVLYVEGKDTDDEENNNLPELAKDELLRLKLIENNQHFTQPPLRFSEPALIKTLDENGVGRPSTYAPIISNILQREYIEREKKLLKPTLLGIAVSDLMSEYFKRIVDVKFTANMEASLDKIESGDLEWVEVIENFYSDFAKTLQKAEKSTEGVKIKIPDVETDVICESCGRKMVVKSGRFGKFLACPGFPECHNTKPIVVETKGECPLCGGKILQKKSKSGHKYFGCENAPKCGFMTWDEPTEEKCPNCSKTLFKKKGGVRYCANENCGYEKIVKRTKQKKTEENK